MAVKLALSRSLLSRLIGVACVVLPAITNADSKLYPQQQWVCQPGNNGSWQCQEKPGAPGDYPKAPAAAVSTANTSSPSNAETPDSKSLPQWDWVAKEQLADPSICNTGCQGAYVEPEPNWEGAESDPAHAPVIADADSSSMADNTVTLTGNVSISQGNRRIRSNSAKLNRQNGELLVEGDVEVRQPSLLVRAQQSAINIDTGLGQFSNAHFLQHDSGVRGSAETLQRISPTITELNKGSFTQCTPDDETWMFRASEIHLDSDKGWGTAKHARLNIKDVPVFYTPYITFPIDDRRKSGFLFPSMGSSSGGGFEFSSPYYLNLAPNYDATIAPRYITNRGTMAELELRQLSQYGLWQLSGAHLGNDDVLIDPDIGVISTDRPTTQFPDAVLGQEDRWIAAVKQKGALGPIRTAIDYTEVSDIDYFDDFSNTGLEVKRTTHLSQKGELSYRSRGWASSLTVQDYQTLDEQLNQQYQLMPQLTVTRGNRGAYFSPEWLLSAEFTDFKHKQSIDEGGAFETGQRTFAEAGLSYPMRWAAGFVVPTTKIRTINYDLEEFKANSDSSPAVTAPMATLDMGLIFDRSTQFGNNRYTQTLEPRLFYFYSDYEDQTGNPDFDTSELTFGYSQLYRDTRFSGHDRLDDANQLSIGATTRFIDEDSGREVITASLGQIFYFDDRKVQLAGQPEELSNSYIASEVQYQPRDRLWISNTLLWDSRKDALREGGISLSYQQNTNTLYNLGYRFRRDGASSLTGSRRNLEQADASLVYPLNPSWSLYSRYQYDVDENRALEQTAGLQYEDCCWMVRFLYQEGFDNEYVDELNGAIVVEQDYLFVLEFQLKGLGNIGNKAITILERSILGYEDLE